MTNTEIYTLYESLVQLSQNKNLKVPAKVGYLFLKNKNLLEPYYKALMEARYGIIEKYAEKTENGQLQVPADKLDIANAELNELLAMEEQNINLSKIKVDSLPDEIGLDLLDNLMLILEE